MICKLIDIIPALHESDSQIPNYFSAKTARSSNAIPSLQYDQGLYLYRVRCPSPVNYDAKQFMDPQILCITKLEKLGTDIYDLQIP